MDRQHKDLFYLCTEFYKYEELLKNKTNSNDNEGYLIEKEAIESIKTNIFYDILKPYSNPKNTIKIFISDRKVKEYLDKYKGIERNIIQVKFKNGENLIKSLNDNKKYYLISKPLWNKICKNENINDKGIPFSFEKNNIILYLNKKNEKLYFKINNGNIEKSSFIEKKSIIRKSERIQENNEEGDNTVNENIVLSNQNFNYKKEIEILIRLFYYQIELKEKKNASSYLFENNKEIVYLINKLWIEKFKIFFEYKELELILKQINNSSTLFHDKYHIYDSLIEDIILKLPINYINKIMKKNKNEFDNKPIKYDYNKINDNRIEIFYLINNQIINYKIYELLNSLEYNISEQIKTDLYFIENNKLVLLFQFPCKEKTEIGYINNKNIFIPEFIIYNNENDISIDILNNFFSNYFPKFKLNKSQNQIQCSYHNTNMYCYKLNNLIENNGNQNNNSLDMLDNEKIEENEGDKTNVLKNKDIELFDKIKKRIKILLLICIYQEDIKKKIKNSINSMNGEGYKNFIVEDIGYLINIDWMNNFKIIYLYDKIYDYLNKKNSLERINDYENKIDDIFYDFKNEFINNFNNEHLYKNNFNILPKLSKIEQYKNILYFQNFYLINSDIYELLQKNYILNEKKYADQLIKTNYIINNGKIIFKFEYNDSNNIFIYKQIGNYSFIPEIIVYFHSNKHEMNEQYEKLKINKNLEYDENNIGKGNNFIKVGSFYLYDNESKIEISKIIQNNQLNKKYIEFILNIYLVRKDLENKAKQNLLNTKIEKYSIIKKDLINEILNYFQYDNFAALIEEYNTDNKINLNEIDKNKDKILNELINGFLPNEHLININNKEKNLQIKNNKNMNENKEIDYKDNIEIIDDNVKNHMIDLFGCIYVEERKIIFRNQKIIMDYKLENNILIGDLENYTFIPEIMINFEPKKPTDYYLSLFQTKGYFSIINELKKNNFAFIRNENEEIRVKVQNINNHKNTEFSSIINNDNDNDNYNYNDKNENSQFDINDNINGNQNDNQNIINNTPNTLLYQQNELGNDLEGNFFSDKEEVNKNILNDKNENQIIEEQNKKSISTEGFREYYNKTHNQKELLPFTQNDIRALILYYFFYLELEQDIKNSNTNIKTSECYLINKNWMNEFKYFYSYEELVKDIETILQKLDVDKSSKDIDKIIYENLNENYIKERKEKQNNYSGFFEDKKIDCKIGKINNEEMGEITYYNKFDILSVKVYDLIFEAKNKSLFDLPKKPYLINDEKLIINLEGKEIFKLFFGHYDFTSHQYFFDFILYNYIDQKSNKYELLKNFHFNKLKIKEISNKTKYLIDDNHENTIFIGKIIEFNNLNNEILKDNENQIDKAIASSDIPIQILNSQSKNNIEFLLRFHFYYKSLRERIKNPIDIKTPEIGYIINKDLLEYYKTYYNYNELEKFCDSKTIDENFFKYPTRNLPKGYIESINKKDKKDYFLSNKELIEKNNQIVYKDNFVVLNEQLFYILYNSNDNIKTNISKIKIKYLIGRKKLIIIYDNYINIGIIDNNCIFKSEKIFYYNIKDELNNKLIEINNIGFDNFEDIFIQEFNKPFNQNKINKNDDITMKNKKTILPYNNYTKVNNFIENKNSMLLGNSNLMNLKMTQKFLKSKNDGMNKEIRNIISIIIDLENIKNKMKMPLISNNLDEYYLLNYNWFKKYLELNNVNEKEYEYLVKLVKNNMNLGNIQNEKLISKIMSEINPNNIKMIIEKEKEKENDYKLKDNDLHKVDSSSFIIKGNITLKYYYNFIIISPETMNSINKYFSFNYNDKKFLILLGDNKAFIKRKTQYVLEICSINNNKFFIPELFFYFFSESIIKKNLSLLQIESYDQYINFYLLFNNDYVSPIFDKNNNNIGYAFKYGTSIKDFSNYLINEQLKAMIKLYFSHAQLKNKLNSDKILEGKYLILDIKYIQKIKEFFDYSFLEKELNKIEIVRQSMILFE